MTTNEKNRKQVKPDKGFVIVEESGLMHVYSVRYYRKDCIERFVKDRDNIEELNTWGKCKKHGYRCVRVFLTTQQKEAGDE